MKLMRMFIGASCLVFAAACSLGVDPGPTQTAHDDIESPGKAETVRAEIHMDAGEFHLTGGESKLIDASFRYSEKVGRPAIRYEVNTGRGVLTLDSPKDAPSGLKNRVNEWTLHMGAKTPMDLAIHLGAGTSDIDVSNTQLRSLEVHMGAGEMKLNLAGKYPKDVPVEVNGGAGTAEIQLPKDMGVEVDAKVGIGSINTGGLQKRDGKYYNDVYAEGKPAIHLDVKGGVGEINLTVAN